MGRTSFKDKVAIITGSARGLGKGFAEIILKGGGFVTISDLEVELGNRTADEFRERFGREKVHFVKCDVTKDDDFRHLWEETEMTFGKPVNILVNNAGVNHTSGWRMCMDVNIMGVMIGSNIAMEKMSKSEGGPGGVIINIASLAGLVPSPRVQSLSYFVAKHGVVALTKSLGSKNVLKAEGIRVTCLCPSFADTAIVDDVDVKKHITKMGIEIMSVNKVVDAFVSLYEEEQNNGSALVVMANIPPFYWPLHDMLLLGYLAAGSALMNKIFPNVKTFRPIHQLAFTIITILLIYVILIKVPLFVLT